MATTNYYNVDGTVIAQESGGTRVGYFSDAAGYTTTTIDESGAVENTYRYKPFGSQLSTSGSGVDPAFVRSAKQIWYENPSIQPSLAENPNMTYAPTVGSTIASTTNKVNSYSLCPECECWASFKLQYQDHNDKGLCGDAFLLCYWYLDFEPFPGLNCFLADGWLVQSVIWSATITICNLGTGSKNDHYFEGWRVLDNGIWRTDKDGNIYPGIQPDDLFKVAGADNTEGDQFKKGLWTYMEGDIAWDAGYTNLMAPNMPVMKDAPPGFYNRPGRDHELAVDWDCCCGTKSKVTNIVRMVPGVGEFVELRFKLD